MSPPNNRVAVIDYGMGNVGSISNMLRKVGATPVVVSTPAELEGVGKIVLPGVGAFDQGMEKLEALGFRHALGHLVLERKVPILGVCLGMHLLTRASEEGRRQGFGWVAADTRRFKSEGLPAHLRIPQMGWNTTTLSKPSVLFDEVEEDQRFYFLHSFHVVCDSAADVLTQTEYGYSFVSAFACDNIVGVQFHPEKSHRFGMEFFRRFVERY